SGTLAKNTLALSMYSSENASFGPLSQTSFQFGTLSQKEKNANLDFTYPIDLNLASPLTLAWGGEYRKETYGSTEGDPQSYSGGPYAVPHPLFQETAPGVFTQVGTTAAKSPGASGYGGTSPTYAGSWSDWSWGAYGDVEADVTDQLSVGVAGRYEHYHSFGGSFVYKVNGIYRVSPAVSVRATLGTGFHAPSPG